MYLASPVIVVWVHTDLLSPEVEGVLAVVHRLELVVVTQVRVTPQTRIDHVRQTLLGSDLKPNITLSDADILSTIMLLT